MRATSSHVWLAAFFLALSVAGCGGAPAVSARGPSATPSPSSSATAVNSATPTPSASPTPTPVASQTPTAPPALSNLRAYDFSATGPFDIVTPGDGNVWLTESSFGQVASLTPAGQIDVYPVVAPTTAPMNSPLGVTVAPDGTLWMADNLESSLSHVSLIGKVLADIPTGGNTSPRFIAYGSDGNLWFTQDQPQSVVGRLTPAGQYASFPQSQAVEGIVAGPDGNLWLLAPQNGVFRLSVSGTSTFFRDPSGTISGPLTVAGDGNIWAGTQGSASGAAMLESISTSGVYTQVPLPGYLGTATAGQPWETNGLYGGSDGYVYFIEDQGYGAETVIGQVTTAGVVRQQYTVAFGVATSDFPGAPPAPYTNAMTLGSDHNLYVIDFISQKVDVWIDPAATPAQAAGTNRRLRLR